MLETDNYFYISDYPVVKTLKAVKEGTDETLEKAMEAALKL